MPKSTSHAPQADLAEAAKAIASAADAVRELTQTFHRDYVTHVAHSDAARRRVVVEQHNHFTGTFERSVVKKTLIPWLREAIKTGELALPGDGR
jgi:hypothetical protein